MFSVVICIKNDNPSHERGVTTKGSSPLSMQTEVVMIEVIVCRLSHVFQLSITFYHSIWSLKYHILKNHSQSPTNSACGTKLVFKGFLFDCAKIISKI